MSQAETLKVCYDQWAPMTIFPSEGNDKRGVVIDMLEHIYEAEGYQLEYYEVPLARGLDMVADGFCDILPEYLYSKSPEVGFVYASVPTFVYTTAFVIRRGDTWRYTGKASLKNKRIATGTGWDYSSMSADYQRFIDDSENANFIEVISGHADVVDRVMLMINERRVDLYADNELVLQYILNRMNLNETLEIVKPGLENQMIEMPIFSSQLSDEKQKKLVTIWNQGRLNMKGDDENKILEKYRISF